MIHRRRNRRFAPMPLLIALVTLTQPALKLLAQQSVVGLEGSSGRDCASCHMTWAESFKRPDAVLLIDRPPESYVSAQENCLGCHDGAVGDARRRVWVEHGHKTGVAPPANIKVPPELPLSDGKIGCRTCHTAHSGSGPETLATTIFLRVQNDAGQLCVMCHADHVKGPAQGSHPLGEMKITLPKVLKDSYAHAGKSDHTLNCQSCHTPHGEREDHLLVLPAENRALCLSCHQEIAPELWKDGRTHPHPQEAKLVTDAQRQTIKDLATRTGPNETLICLSCHKMHTAVPGTHILADTNENSALCIRCHAEKKPVLGTDHDLRKTAPDAVNLLKQTATTGGPCSACHGVHNTTRENLPAAADPSGQCLTCHRQGQCAEKKTGDPLSHPIDPGAHVFPADMALKLHEAFPDKSKRTIACLTCHNPHESTNGHFLRARNDTLCATCHGDQARMAGGGHDFTQHADLRNAKGRTASDAGKCGFCHAVHDAKGPMLWAATAEPPATASDLCVACHKEGGLAIKAVAGALRHPAGPATAAPVQAMKASFPLFGASGHTDTNGFIACATCHDPHAGKGQHDLLRVAAGEPATTMCLTCHADARPLPQSLHALPIIHQHINTMPQLGQATACGPCHSTHALAGMPAAGMWAGPKDATQPTDLAQCLGCHSKAGGAAVITPTIHPPVLTQNVAERGQPGFMPLFDDNGHEAATGRISCRTCHLPHGREDLSSLWPGTQPADPLGNLAELRSLRPMVRAYDAPNLCSSCHAADGLRRYLYYHAKWRKIENGE